MKKCLKILIKVVCIERKAAAERGEHHQHGAESGRRGLAPGVDHFSFTFTLIFDCFSHFFCQHAETKGLAPELMDGIMGILKPSAGAGGGGGDGGAAGGGIDMATVMGLIGSLTNRWFGWSDWSNFYTGGECFSEYYSH